TSDPEPEVCAFSWERTHPACRESKTLSTREACAPRDDLRGLCVSAVTLLGCACCGWAALCSSVVSFRLLVVAADGAVARVLRHALPGGRVRIWTQAFPEPVTPLAAFVGLS